MIAVDRFECTIPSRNAVKHDVISCVGTVPDNYLVLGDVATWVTAIATILLVIGAAFAWREARNTRNLMQSEAMSASVRFDKDLVQRAEQAHQVRVDTATNALISSLADLISASRETDDDVLRTSAEVRKATVQYNLVWEFRDFERSRVTRFTTALVSLARAASHEDLRIEGALHVLDSGYSDFCDWVSELARGEIEMDEFTPRLAEHGNRICEKHDRWFRLVDARSKGEGSGECTEQKN